MPRSLSALARQAMFDQEAHDVVILLLLEISHPTIPIVIRLVNDMKPITHGGNVYQAAAFIIALPAEQDERPPQVRLRIDNVDQAIVTEIRAVPGPPAIVLKVILANTPDVIEAGPFSFTLRSAEYDAMEVVGTLAFEDILNESYPKDAFTPALYPGLFRDL